MTTYPVRVRARLDPGLNRWLWLVKWFLAIPHYLVLSLLWAAFTVLSVVAFVAILVTGRYPRSLFEFNLGVLRWTWRVGYYTVGALGTDRYPPFSLGEEPDYPATLDIAYPERLSRGLALVKWLLVVPHLLVVGVFLGGGGYAVSRGGEWAFGLVGLFVLIAGVALLFTGRYPRGVFDFVLGMDRWVLRVAAYAGLMTDAYPPFRLDTGGDEPGPAFDPPAPATRGGGAAGGAAGGGAAGGGAVGGAVGGAAGGGAGGGAAGGAAAGGGAAGRIVAAVFGVLLLVAGAGFSATGAITLWAHQTQRGADGMLSTPSQPLHSNGYALEMGAADLHRTGTGWFLGDDWLGEVGLRADPGTFVGIGPSDDVDRYLSTVDRDRVLSIGERVEYNHVTGGAPVTVPSAQRFWVASGTGSLTWQVVPGRWTAVVMNADGTRVVDTTVAASASLPALALVAWLLIPAGVLMLVFGGVLLFFAAFRSNRTRGEKTHA
ncbi:DUF4389 domain-containing protein [Saccharothrix variisporea]|uniref:Uncharacterized protein DUF4389 n=1 Tax=Saccharothrix variisporea TaxID=543527 RepID=A0A495X6S7_9PSEU|nr:DUF4389 domain-containing protein [Saccharothrix variisporea]RKT69239.1 uncharacterized protein DUF4389 [Saccharothrix variisporea]